MRILRTMVVFAGFVLSAVPAYAGMRVTATFLPVWIFTANVAGEAADVSLLIPPGTDVHEFSLRPQDLAALEEADLLVINGGGLESRFLKSPLGDGTVDASRGIELIRNGSPDPHVWLDPVLAMRQVRNIRDALVLRDPENSVYYEGNAEEYIRRLSALHGEAREALEGLGGKHLISFHESFAYFARRYGLVAYSLTGPDAEQPLPRRMKEVYDMVRREGIRAVFSESQFPSESLDRLRRDLGVRVCTLDTLESGDPDPGYYEEAMRKNVRTIVTCLGEKED